MTKTIIYATDTRVIKRFTTSQAPSFNSATESIYVVPDDFSTENGPWKFDVDFNKVPATQQEYDEAQEDKASKKLRADLLAFHNSALAYKAAVQAGTVTNMASFLPLFNDLLRDLDEALFQFYKTTQ